MADSLGLYPVSAEMANFIQDIYLQDPSRVKSASYMNNTTTSTQNFTFSKIEGYTLFLVAYTATSTNTDMTVSSALAINTSDVSKLYLLISSGTVACQWGINDGKLVVMSHSSVTITIVALG